MAHPKDFEQARAEKRDRGNARRLAGYYRGYLGLLAAALLVTLLASGSEYARAYLLKVLIDDVAIPQATLTSSGQLEHWLPNLPLFDRESASTEQQDTPDAPPLAPEQRAELRASIEENLLLILALAALIAIAMPGLTVLREYMAAYVLGRIKVDMSREACAKLLALPLSFHHGRQRGEVYARVASDLGVAHRALSLFFNGVLAAIITVTVGVAFMIAVSWQLSLFMAAGAPLLFDTISFFGRIIRRGAGRRQRQVAEVTQRLLEILQGIKVIKAFNAESSEYNSYSREAHRLFKRSLRVTRNQALSRASVEFVNQVMTVAGLCLGVYMLLSGMWGLTLGDLAAFMFITSLVYRPLKRLTQSWVSLQDAMAGAERYFEVLDTPLEVQDLPGAVDLAPVRKSIAVRGLSFGYGAARVLQDVNFEAKAGEVVAVVGPTGAGKTTLSDLLIRLYDPQEGCIEIDGTDLRELRRESLLAQVAVVTQEPFLFDGTIRENLLYGRPDATEKELTASAHAAHLDEFVDELANGYDTLVGPAGARLSGGQRQRITIGRAILKDPSILILDEATSSLDSKSEKYVQEAIDALLCGDRTVFVIAHRLSTVRRADRILVLENGSITQQGTHEELMAAGGLYRELVALQTGTSIDAR
ncbi:MAG: ABC transporter ATP-binding protein [Myxococcota bacterium]|nr:ABC transporter ATP-binding protein [Myxococcota bacterium]